MFMNAPFRRKDSEIETEPCYVETAITLSQYDFNYFKTHLLEDQEFIKNNIDKMGYSQDGTRHCILVLSEGSNDGVLVDSQGSNYARYIAFMSNAKTLYNLDRYLDLSNYVDDMTKFADFCADRILKGQDDGRFVLSLSSMKHEYGLHSLDAELIVNMLSSREEFEILDFYDNKVTVKVNDDFAIKSNSNLGIMSNDEIKIALAKHLLWLNDEYGGVQLDLRNKYIEGFDFSRQDLSSAVLNGSRFVNCDFYKATLCFTEACGTCFNDCQLHDVTVEEGNFYQAEFRDCNMERGMYTHSNFHKAKFVQSGISGMNFTNACVAEVSWINTDTTNATMKNTVDAIEKWDGDTPHYDMEWSEQQ